MFTAVFSFVCVPVLPFRSAEADFVLLLKCPAIERSIAANAGRARTAAVCMYVRVFSWLSVVCVQVRVDPSVVISLKTRWSVLQPTEAFAEGSMLPLAGVLDDNEHVK